MVKSVGNPTCKPVSYSIINVRYLDSDVSYGYNDALSVGDGVSRMITAGQMRAARALLALDQRDLAEQTGLSLPTIQRMEASDGVIRGNVDSLMKLIAGLEAAGIELIGEGATSSGGGRGVRLKG
jgi:DNA-binding XRE family transcriptional regulator